MYGEHPNGGMIKIDFCIVDFLEDEFPTIGEVKKDVELFELQQNIQASFGEGGIWILTKSLKMVCLPYPKGIGETCLPRRMRFILDLLYMRKVNLLVRSVLNLQFPNIQLVHMFGIPHPREIVGETLHMLRVPHLLEKGGGMPHPGRQTMKAPGSEEVSVEEFLDDISTSKRKYSYALAWKLRSLPLIKRQLTHQTTKSGWMP